MKILFLLLFLPVVYGDRIVHTNTGPIKGFSLAQKKVEAFLGIPYAEPPVGPLRFSKPVAKSTWKDVYEAKELPKACVQAIMGFLKADAENMSEDCLYLNIWTPRGENHLKPIMVYIHGGAFMVGSSNLKIYDGANLAEWGDVIVATINYRLGSLGFFSAGTHTEPPHLMQHVDVVSAVRLLLQQNSFIDEAAGNMGMYDQLMAIQWIKDNAKQFGGDPDNIVLFGQSAGAFSISFHMISPLSKNLFRRAILQSGSAYHPIYSEKNEVLVMGCQAIAKMLGCADEKETLKNNPKKVVDCMKALPAKAFSDTDLAFFRNGGILLPRVGDTFLPENPIDMFRKRAFKNSELLLGINRDEGTSFLSLQKPDIFGMFGQKVDASAFDENSAKQIIQAMVKIDDGNKILQNYLDRPKYESRYTYLNAMGDILGDYLITCSSIFQADHHSFAGNRVYFYLFDYRSASSPRAEWMGVSHFDEVQYVFGNPFYKNLTEYEKELSRDIMDMWTSFAKTGDPNIPGGLKWSPYTHDNPNYFIIGRTDSIGVKPDNYRCERWRNIFRSSIKDTSLLQTLKNSILKMLRL